MPRYEGWLALFATRRRLTPARYNIVAAVANTPESPAVCTPSPASVVICPLPTVTSAMSERWHMERREEMAASRAWGLGIGARQR